MPERPQTDDVEKRLAELGYGFPPMQARKPGPRPLAALPESQPQDIVTALANELRTAQRLGLVQPESIVCYMLAADLVVERADAVTKVEHDRMILNRHRRLTAHAESREEWWRHLLSTLAADLRTLVAGGEV